MILSIRNLLGVLIKDLWRYQQALLAQDNSYLSICNRHENLQVSPDGDGFACNWQWTSNLYAPKIIPQLGKQLFKKTLAHHPIAFAATPTYSSFNPHISFIIGHRGTARLSHLLKTLESIAGQIDIEFECIVVEQDSLSLLPKHLPSWVKYIHTPPPIENMPYCRSWAFNVGAKMAMSEILVFHDNDFLISQDYAKEIVRRIREGYEVINLKRFLFYLSSSGTQQFFDKHCSLIETPLEKILQNLEAGGSIAIKRQKYWEIGGFDESFIGWGGEDNEFWERAQTLKVWNYGYLPMVHLWHPSQPEKKSNISNASKLFWKYTQIPIEQRISKLKNSIKGSMESPVINSIY